MRVVHIGNREVTANSNPLNDMSLCGQKLFDGPPEEEASWSVHPHVRDKDPLRWQTYGLDEPTCEACILILFQEQAEETQ